jgi:hypothetical protein
MSLRDGSSRLRQEWWASLTIAERLERLKDMQGRSLPDYNERREAEARAWGAAKAARAEKERHQSVPPLPPLRDLVAERDEAERAKQERIREIQRLRQAGEERARERRERAAQRRKDDEAARLAEAQRFSKLPSLPPLLDPAAEPAKLEPAPATAKRKREVEKKRKIAKPRAGRPSGSTIELKPAALQVLDAWPTHRRRDWAALYKAVCDTYDLKREKVPSLSTVQRRAKDRWS